MHLKLGRVVIEVEVEIVANSTVDRGCGRDTLIGKGSKIYYIVMISLGVKMGPSGDRMGSKASGLGRARGRVGVSARHRPLAGRFVPSTTKRA